MSLQDLTLVSSDSKASGIKIKSAIEDCWTPPDNYYHLRNGGHVAAMKAHCSNTCFIHLDIKNFFGAINKSRVTRCLKRHFGYSDARLIARESTVKHPTNPKKYILPFGFVQSPIIASICLFKSSLGKHLNKLSFTKDVVVSVYMDDIIISMEDEDMADDILCEVKCAADKSRLPLNEIKEEGPADQVTAFNINLSHKNLKIDDVRLSEFIDNFTLSGNDAQRKGIRQYIKSVNTDQSQKLV